MTSGGHARSGPQPDSNSLRGAKRGQAGMTMLPADGYHGERPDWPFPDMTMGEGDLWRWAWKQPQAAQWAREEWRWVSVAMWVRFTVKVSNGEGKTGDSATMSRLADEIGMTPSGLRLNGWAISQELPRGREDEEQPAGDSARNRLKLVPPGA
jgi:hypothetical protein